MGQYTKIICTNSTHMEDQRENEGILMSNTAVVDVEVEPGQYTSFSKSTSLNSETYDKISISTENLSTRNRKKLLLILMAIVVVVIVVGCSFLVYRNDTISNETNSPAEADKQIRETKDIDDES